MLELLKRVIEERTEYSNWMSKKLTDSIPQVSETHQYQIKILSEIAMILATKEITT